MHTDGPARQAHSHTRTDTYRGILDALHVCLANASGCNRCLLGAADEAGCWDRDSRASVEEIDLQ